MSTPDYLVSTHDLTDAELESSYEPIGRFITAHTQLDLLVGRMLAAFVGLDDHLFADHLIHSVESGRKKQMLDAIATIFKADPLGIIEGYVPNPDLHGRIKSFALRYEDATKRRNVLCHGTFGRNQNRVLVGSVSAERLFRNDGARSSWVFIDELPRLTNDLMATLSDGKSLQGDFARAHVKLGYASKPHADHP